MFNEHVFVCVQHPKLNYFGIIPKGGEVNLSRFLTNAVSLLYCSELQQYLRWCMVGAASQHKVRHEQNWARKCLEPVRIMTEMCCCCCCCSFVIASNEPCEGHLDEIVSINRCSVEANNFLLCKQSDCSEIAMAVSDLLKCCPRLPISVAPLLLHPMVPPCGPRSSRQPLFW